MIFGRPTDSSAIILNGSPVDFVSQWKYLGVVVLAGKNFPCSARKALASIYNRGQKSNGPNQVVIVTKFVVQFFSL